MDTRRVAVRAVIQKDGKLFCVKLNNYKGDGSNTLGTWITVGGKADIGEPLLGAITREVIEETGVTPVVGNLLFVQQFSHHSTEQLEFFFHVTNAGDFENIDLSKTSHGIEEISEFAFVDPKDAEILPKFLNEVDLSKLGTEPVKFFNYMTAG